MKIEHQLFAHHFILTGDRDKAYKIAYPAASGEPLRNAARRLINTTYVREYISTRMAELQQNAAQHHHDEQKRLEEQEYATLLLKRKVLRQMIGGQQKQLRHFKFKDHVETIEEQLTPFAIIRAIELDTKLAGEWYNRNGKTAEAQVAEKPKQQWINFYELCEHKYGPDYLPAMRARFVKDNPRMAEEYKKDGLRVLDHIPDNEEYERMEQEQKKRLETLEEEYQESKPLSAMQIPDPPSLNDAYPAPKVVLMTNPTTPAQSTHKVVQSIISQATLPPPLVNPMSVPPPESRLELSKEQMQQRLQQSYEELTKHPESMFYITPTSKTPQNNTG